ncbi:SLOG cluster 4 domain-containing protein [Arthrobacter sp. MDT3-24]
MPIDPALRVIAVFGSNSPNDQELAAAKLIGAQISKAGAVLMTGGDLQVDQTGSVKNAAILAASKVESKGRSASWIGVANESQAAKPQWRGPRSLVVTPGWRHRRNLVEACLCDAAIAIGVTSAGTASEALFSLYLGRPLVVAGDIPEAERNAQRLYHCAATRIPPPQYRAMAIDRGILGAYTWASETDAVFDVQPLPVDAASASSLAKRLLDQITQHSPRPDFDELVGEANWDRFVMKALRAAGRA